MSSIMSSWPPTMPRRPISTRMSRAGTPYFFSARLANSRKGAIHPGIAERERVAVDADQEVHDRHHQVFGHVLDPEHIHAGFDAHQLAHRDQHSIGCCRHPRRASRGRIDAGGADFDRGDAVGHAHGEVVVAMEAQFGLGLRASRTAPRRALTVSGSRWPAESVT